MLIHLEPLTINFSGSSNAALYYYGTRDSERQFTLIGGVYPRQGGGTINLPKGANFIFNYLMYFRNWIDNTHIGIPISIYNGSVQNTIEINTMYDGNAVSNFKVGKTSGFVTTNNDIYIYFK